MENVVIINKFGKDCVCRSVVRPPGYEARFNGMPNLSLVGFMEKGESLVSFFERIEETFNRHEKENSKIKFKKYAILDAELLQTIQDEPEYGILED